MGKEWFVRDKQAFVGRISGYSKSNVLTVRPLYKQER